MKRGQACFVGVALVLSGLWGFYGPHLFGLGADDFWWVSFNEPAWRWTRDLHEITPWFPPWFWPSTALLMAGIAVCSCACFKRKMAELGEPLRAKSMPGFSRADFLRRGIAIPTLIVLVVVGLIGAKVVHGGELSVWPWLLGIAAVLTGCFAKDALSPDGEVSERRSLLTRPEFTALLATVGHLAVLGILHRAPEMRVWTTSGDLVILALCWCRWPKLINFWLLQGLLVVSMFYYVVDIESWRYGSIGDEFDFYATSRWLVAHSGERGYLDGEGVYGHHPLSASFHQMWGEMLFGNQVYGWRMSGVFCAQIAGLGLFAVLREMINTRTALMGCAVLLASNRMVAMAMTGYNQMQGLAMMVMFWAVLLLAIRRGSYLGYALAGMLAVGGLFTFTLAVPLMLIGAALMLSAGFPKRGKRPANPENARSFYTFAPLCVFLVGLTLVALPRVVDMTWISGQLDLAGLNAGNSAHRASLGEHIALSSLYSVLAFGQIREGTHYASGPLLDPLSALAFIVGLVWLIAGGWRLRYGRWLALSLVGGIGVVGGLCVHPFPPNTRLFILVPIYALVVTTGLVQAGRFIAARLKTPRWQGVSGALGVVCVAALFALNWWQLHGVLDRTAERNSYQYILKILAEERVHRPVFIVGRDGNEADANLDKALAIYGYSKTDYTDVINVQPSAYLRDLARGVPTAIICLQKDTVALAEWRRAAQENSPQWRETVIKDGLGVPHLVTLELGR